MTPLPQMPRCINLQSKALMVYGESYGDDPDYQAGMDQTWCVMTAKPLGPDNGDVGWDECRNAVRSCYRDC